MAFPSANAPTTSTMAISETSSAYSAATPPRSLPARSTRRSWRRTLKSPHPTLALTYERRSIRLSPPPSKPGGRESAGGGRDAPVSALRCPSHATVHTRTTLGGGDAEVPSGLTSRRAYALLRRVEAKLTKSGRVGKADDPGQAVRDRKQARLHRRGNCGNAAVRSKLSIDVVQVGGHRALGYAESPAHLSRRQPLCGDGEDLYFSCGEEGGGAPVPVEALDDGAQRAPRKSLEDDLTVGCPTDGLDESLGRGVLVDEPIGPNEQRPRDGHPVHIRSRDQDDDLRELLPDRTDQPQRVEFPDELQPGQHNELSSRAEPPDRLEPMDRVAGLCQDLQAGRRRDQQIEARPHNVERFYEYDADRARGIRGS